MHSIVTTPGFVIDSRAYGEADKIYYIFTRDQGLVRAVAQGIRLEKSKLRYHIRENEMGNFSLVRGKEVWRLTNAQESESSTKNSSNTELLARLSLILRRVLHGEEANPDLFCHIENLTEFLSTNIELTQEQVHTLESLVVLRALHSLGYVGNDADVQDCFTTQGVAIGLINSLISKRTLINKHINKAIKESHL
jgi:DNA repair protein RecO